MKAVVFMNADNIIYKKEAAKLTTSFNINKHGLS